MTRKKLLILLVSAVCFPGTSRFAVGQSFLDQLEGAVREGLDNLAAPTLQPPVNDATEAQKAYLGLVGDDNGVRGVRVLSVKPDAPAETAGLRPNDLITSIDGVAINSMDDLGNVLSKMKAGDRAKFGFNRDGVSREATVTLAAKRVAAEESNPFESPEDASAPLSPDSTPVDPLPVAPGDQPRPSPLPPPEPAPPTTQPLPRSSTAVGRGSLGITVGNVDQQTRLQYRLAASQGAVVTSVMSGSPANKIGLTPGAVIVAFDGRRIATSGDIVREMQASRAGQRVELTYYLGPQLRRSQVVLASDSPAAAPADAYERPRFSLQQNGQRGPLLDRVERLLDNIVPPGNSASPRPPASADLSPRSDAFTDDYQTTLLRTEIETMHAQIEQLQKQVTDLQQRLKALERGQQ